MNSDLERQLKEMGPAYRAVADRLVAAYRPADDRSASHEWRLVAVSLLAASLLLVAAFGVFFGPSSVAVPVGARAYRLAGLGSAAAIHEIVMTQRADGSWENDFLTRQNVAALRGAVTAEARIAYKKAMRNLRTRGLL